MRKWIPLIAILLGTFMLLVDVTIVNVALPAIAGGLETTFSSLQWVVDAYALTLAALLLGIGALADVHGHRRAYLAGLVVFALASLACGLAPNAAVLIGARAVQGVGGAAMFATTFALLNSTYTGRDRGTAYGLWGAVAGASAALGPVLGGLLVQGLSWHWVFFVNLPVSVLAVVMCLRSLAPDVRGERRPVDLPGTITFTLAAAALTVALIRTSDVGWTSPSTYGLIALSAVALAAFIAVEAHSAAPLLDLGLFRRASFVGTMLAALLLNLTAFSVLTYSTIWLQSVLELTPIQAGLVGMPLAGMAFVVSGAIGRLLHDRAPGPIIATGLAFIGAGGLVCALVLRGDSSWPALVPGFLLTGIGVGLATPTLASSAMSAVPVQRGGMAAGAVNTARQLGFALGIALLGSVVGAGARASLADSPVGGRDVAGLASGLIGGQAPGLLARAGSGRQTLDAALRAAAVHGLLRGFLLVGVLGLVTAVVVAVLVRRPAGAHAAGSGRHRAVAATAS